MKHTLILAAARGGIGGLQRTAADPRERRRAPDTAAFQGTGMPFAAPGWKQGDKVSWEQQLKTRTQNGQNDYTKVN